MKDVTPAYVKVLFGQMVRLAGGTDAAGLILGLSNQRVSQLQSLNCADQPSALHLIKLHVGIESPFLTDALTALAGGTPPSRDLQKETREHLHAAANLDALASSNAPPKAISDALTKAQRELADVAHVLAANE